MNFLIRSAADQTVPDRLISAPRSINFCPPEVSVFVFWSIAQERTLLTQVLYLYHTHSMSACLPANATSPQCYISSRTQSAFLCLKHCARENAFDTSVILISLTQHVFLQMLHLLNATSPHGRSQRFCVWSIAQERTLLTQVLYLYHTHSMSSCKCYISSMLHLLTDALAGWKLCLLSITRCNTLSP